MRKRRREARVIAKAVKVKTKRKARTVAENRCGLSNLE
jgi:hypothetical protein